MVSLAQGVDHWHARPLGEQLLGPVGERARDDCVKPAVEIARYVGRWLPLTDAPVAMILEDT